MTIALTCTDCGHTWTRKRLTGPTPSRCNSCKAQKARASRLVNEARGRGLQADAVLHAKHGWVCAVTSPTGELTVLHDAYDIAWFQSEHTGELLEVAA